ncbi:MAG: hypothetical protein PHP75_00650, partial [Methylacidiphilaceae bacterium]|nr:hypothetical protein [Candidatus Methylacidiphilaceae bacterium]
QKESDLATARAQMAMYRLWAKAHQMGLKVVAGDYSWSTLTKYNVAGLHSPGGIRSRNEALADSIAAYARHGRVTAFLGALHTGWGDRAQPGVGQILVKKHGVLAPSVATPTIRNKEGYLALQDEYHLPPYSSANLQQRNDAIARFLASDTTRVLRKGGIPILDFYPEAIDRLLRKTEASP